MNSAYRDPKLSPRDEPEYRRQSRVARRRVRRAFTLIEVVLALGISVVLLAAVYSAIDLYRQLETSGKDQLERGQLARALFRRMEIDIRSVVPPQDSPAVSGSAGGDDDEDEDDEEEDEVEALPQVDPESLHSTATVGLVGDAETLVLNIVRPSRPIVQATQIPDMEFVPSAGDQKSVSYFLAVDGAKGLRGLIAQAGRDTASQIPGVRGLAVLEGDRLVIQTADQQAGSEALAPHARLLAEEVDRVRFEYFNGLIWLDSWDSTLSGRVPNAVRITIGFRSASTAGTDQILGDAIAAGEEYDTVISIPIADPPAADADAP